MWLAAWMGECFCQTIVLRRTYQIVSCGIRMGIRPVSPRGQRGERRRRRKWKGIVAPAPRAVFFSARISSALPAHSTFTIAIERVAVNINKYRRRKTTQNVSQQGLNARDKKGGLPKISHNRVVPRPLQEVGDTTQQHMGAARRRPAHRPLPTAGPTD